jgi:hypothetical protein
VPSRTIPEGIAALLAFDYEADFDSNTRIMTEALAAVKTIEITRAVRATQFNGFAIKKKQAIGLLGGTIVAVADEPLDVLRTTLTKAGLKKAEVVTLYYGQDTDEAEAQQVKEEIASKYRNLQVEVVRGGQPHYNFIGSVE